MRLSASKLGLNSKSVLVVVVVAMAAGSFVVSGVGTGLSGIGSLDRNMAAQVGDQPIPMRTLGVLVERMNQQAGGQLDDSRRAANVQNALNSLVQTKILAEEADRYKLAAHDLEVAERIRRDPRFINETTKAFDPEMYKRFLKSGQSSEIDLFREKKDEVAIMRFQSLLELPAHTPAKLIEDQRKLNATQFELEHAEVKLPEATVRELVAAELPTYIADEKNIEKLKQSFEKNKSEFNRKPQVKVQTLLVAHAGAERAFGDAAKRTEEQAKALAEKLAARAKAGESFAKLSKEANDDVKASVAGGSLGWIDETGMDPESSKVAFGLNKSNPVSGAIKTPFGYRIVKWEDARPAVEKSFEEVKEELARRELSKTVREKASLKLVADVNTALAAKDNKKLDELFKSHDISWKKIKDPVTPGMRFIPEVGAMDPLIPHLFHLQNKGDTVPQLLEFLGKQEAIRLVSRSAGEAKPEPMEDLIRARQDQQVFASATIDKLYNDYKSRKLIITNERLMR